MYSNNFSGDMSSMLDQASAVTGKSRAELEQMISRNPQAANLLSRISPEDMQKLQQVLNDPKKAQRLLATPQAQALLRSLQRGSHGGGSNNG